MKKLLSVLAFLLFTIGLMGAEATIAKGQTNSYDGFTINGKPAIKCGTSKASGDMTITVGSGATSLKFHAVAWKDKSEEIELTFTAPAGVTLTQTTFMIKPNDSITGSDKDFELDNEDNYLFEVGISGAESETTFSVTTENKRFIIWEATYETGTATAIEHNTVDKNCIKVFNQGKLLIKKGNKVYTTLGNRIY